MAARPLPKFLETEQWDDGTSVTWLECPIPYGGRRPLTYGGEPERVAIIPLDSIRATQKRVTLEGLEKHARGYDDLPIVVETEKGERLIADGHHRLSAAWVAGKKAARVRLVSVDERPRKNPADEPVFLNRHYLVAEMERRHGAYVDPEYLPQAVVQAALDAEGAIYDRLDVIGRKYGVDADFVLQAVPDLPYKMFCGASAFGVSAEHQLHRRGMDLNRAFRMLMHLDKSRGVERALGKLHDALARAARG